MSAARETAKDAWLLWEGGGVSMYLAYVAAQLHKEVTEHERNLAILADLTPLSVMSTGNQWYGWMP